jgi:hypothetical protein
MKVQELKSIKYIKYQKKEAVALAHLGNFSIMTFSFIKQMTARKFTENVKLKVKKNKGKNNMNCRRLKHIRIKSLGIMR